MKRFLFLYIFILIIVLFLGCLQEKNSFLLGTYQGQVVMKASSSQVSSDTLFNTIVVINKDFSCQNCYTLQWTFDNYIYLKQKLVKIPNVYTIGLEARPCHGRLAFFLKDTNNIKDFRAYYKNDSLKINFVLPKEKLRVKIQAYRPDL